MSSVMKRREQSRRLDKCTQWPDDRCGISGDSCGAVRAVPSMSLKLTLPLAFLVRPRAAAPIKKASDDRTPTSKLSIGLVAFVVCPSCHLCKIQQSGRSTTSTLVQIQMRHFPGKHEHFVDSNFVPVGIASGSSEGWREHGEKRDHRQSE